MKMDLPISKKKFIDGLVGTIAVKLRHDTPEEREGVQLKESDRLKQAKVLIVKELDRRLFILGGIENAKV